MPASTFTVDDLIVEVRDLHASFDEQFHPAPLVLRRLQNVQDSLIALASSRNAAWWAATEDVDVPASLDELVEVPPYRFILGATVLLKNARVDAKRPFATHVAFGARQTAGPRFPFTMIDGKLCFVPTSQWQLATALSLQYAPKPKLLKFDSKFEVPDEARTALLYSTGLMLAARGVGEPPVPPATVTQWSIELNAAQSRFADSIAGGPVPQKMYVRDVMG